MEGAQVGRRDGARSRAHGCVGLLRARPGLRAQQVHHAEAAAAKGGRAAAAVPHGCAGRQRLQAHLARHKRAFSSLVDDAMPCSTL